MKYPTLFEKKIFLILCDLNDQNYVDSICIIKGEELLFNFKK